ncbi:sulfatase family protein [Solicola gregarius]|uniref:Sulfatase n=1 Tax=Solicola gregarius TaxID=2908642 RepID=A0AA46TFH5_9ACTN|nr:sulfatase [Solicola gregarius]UYM04366.1 sulfatase [Solicola gregarius]
MRRNGQRAVSLGVTALAVTMTGSLLSDAGAAAPAPSPDPTSSGKLLEGMRLHASKTVGVDGLGGMGSRRPNIVWIMTDDMRQDELGDKWMRRTRKLIARQGVTFQNSFAPTPLCAPARASFLSGKYVQNHRVRGVKDPYGFRSFRDRNTLPVWLRKSGYNTAYLGKYINGYGRQNRRNGRPSERYVPPGWSDWRASLDNHGTYNYYNTHLNRNGKRQSLAGKYQTTQYGRIGSSIIKRYAARKKPFFFNLSFTAPHHGGPREPDDRKGVKSPARAIKSIGKFDRQTRRLPDPDGEPGNRRKPAVVSKKPALTKRARNSARSAYRQRAEAGSTVDQQVKRLMGTLRRTGELDNTYVIFTSDNGYLLGEARRVQGKTLPYDASLATPLAIRGPGIPRGGVRKDPFTSIDFASTIADMAKAKVRAKVDGMSMLDVARKGDRGWRRPILTNTGARRGKKALGQGIRVKGFLYAEYRTRGRKRELYDLNRDPHELHNLAGSRHYRFTEKRLRSALHHRWHCSGAACRKPIKKYVR